MNEPSLLEDRRVDFAGLDPSVRRVVYTTFAALAGVALGVMVRGFLPEPHVTAAPGYKIPLVVALISAVVANLAVAAILAGASIARTRWRYLIIAPTMTWLAYVTAAGEVDQFALPTSFPDVLPLVAALAFLVIGSVIIGRARRHADRPPFVLLALLCFACSGLMVLHSLMLVPSYAPTVLLFGVIVGIFLMQPAVLVVGFDIAEIGAAAAWAGVARLMRLRGGAKAIPPLVLLTGLAVAAAVPFIGGFRDAFGAGLIAGGVVILGLAAWFVSARLASRREPTAQGDLHLQYLRVALVAFIPAAAILLCNAWQEDDPAYFNNHQGHPFSVQLPEGMKPVQLTAPTPATGKPALSHAYFETTPPLRIFTGIAAYAVDASGKVPPLTLADVIGEPNLRSAPIWVGQLREGYWSGYTFEPVLEGTQLHAALMTVQVASPSPTYNVRWFIGCMGRPEIAPQINQLCLKLGKTFVGDERFRTTPLSTSVLAVAFLAGAVALQLVLIAMSKRRSRPTLDFLFWLLLLAGLCATWGVLIGRGGDAFEDLSVLADLMCAVVTAVIVAALIVRLPMFDHRAAADGSTVRDLAMRSVVEASAIGALFLLYFELATAPDFAVVRGVIVFIGLTWELYTAGSLLNPGQDRPHLFPQMSRALMFAGYLMLVALGVFLLAPIQLATGVFNAGWTPENAVAAGIALLGGALVLTRLTRRLAS